MRTSGWVRAGQVAAGVGRLLPAAVLSVFVVVIGGAFLGAVWGLLIAVVWLLTGFAAFTPVGERAAVRGVLRYRPAPGWPPTSPPSPPAGGCRCTSPRDCPGCSVSAGAPSRSVPTPSAGHPHRGAARGDGRGGA